MKKTTVIHILFLFFLPFHSPAQPSFVVANPMNLNYRFQFESPSYREAADPVCEYFKGKYYLFASKSGGYWSSSDLAAWDYIPCTSIRELENYAPSILIRNDSIYFIASGSKIYRTADPDLDQWEEIPTKFNLGVTDPAFFQDDDGRVYLYWGCSDKDPIEGVEVDPLNEFAPLGSRIALIPHNSDKYGWEVQGENNDNGQTGWNEGPCMIKYKGKYYLQYASPGTQFRIYADGIYVSDRPLGSFVYQEYSPFSIKTGGFIGGAGHGHTFRDKYGNYWHVASMKISRRHLFERRLGLFPVYFNAENEIYANTVLTDYPFFIPDRKVDFETENIAPDWHLLSYEKPAAASSSYSAFLPASANDEKIERWWSAQTGNAGEWWQVDLEKTMKVYAVQVNFADQDFTNRATDSPVFYRYEIEISGDGEHWAPFIDRTQNTSDRPHELIVAGEPADTRFLRITNRQTMNGKFSLSGFRVFGKGNVELPEEVSGIRVKRQSRDGRRFLLTWNKQENATGYIVRWGTAGNKRNHAAMVFDAEWEAGCFNRDSPCFFSIDAFNESGITTGNTVLEGEVFLGDPYRENPHEIPGTFEAEDFNEGGQAYAYYDTSPGNLFWEYRPEEQVDINYDRRTKTFFLANTATGEYTNYTVYAPEAGLYDFDCICASAQKNAEGGFYITFNGERPSAPSLETIPAGSASSFHTVTLPDLFFNEGKSVLTFNMAGSIYADKFTVRPSGTGLNPPNRMPVSVFPNPSPGIFNIKIPQPASLTVFNLAGQTVYRDKNSSSACKLDFTNELPGIYLLLVQMNNRNYRIKLVKNT
ncbi:MAG: family 43 glycosylhydrolase [Candidatus Symbiothrix sp.]|nr:family 43 glycosylhydrolase [Candidatus Symbiothrix sp.]